MCSSPVKAPDTPAEASPYRRCGSCSGLFLEPYPSQQSNTLFDGPSAAIRQQTLEAARSDYFLRHLIRLEKHLDAGVQNPRLMEIGCGSGVLLQTAINRGWQADALEMSPELADIARATNPLATITVVDVLAHTRGSGGYDAVMALDVVEHVLDPELMLKNCRAMLKPGGLLLLQTPNTRGLRCRSQGTAWEMRDAGQHINLFSSHGLTGLLKRTGFCVEVVQTVSGSGMETGGARILAETKQWVLGLGNLGNALCVLARRI